MITIAAICKDEETLIGKWIEHLFSCKVIDKIVLIDTGSTDNTKKIIDNVGDKIIKESFQWNNSFADARNRSIELAKETDSEYIMMMDVDEFLGPLAKIELESMDFSIADAHLFRQAMVWDKNKIVVDPVRIMGDMYPFEVPGWRCSVIAKDKIGVFQSDLHEWISMKGLTWKLIGSGRTIIRFADMMDEPMVGHYPYPKLRLRAGHNGTNFEIEEGRKRMVYRKIREASANNKLYTPEWANQDRSWDEIEELGRNQLAQLLEVEKRMLMDVDLDGWHCKEAVECLW